MDGGGGRAEWSVVRLLEWSTQLVQPVTWLDIKTSLFKSDKWRPSGGRTNEREGDEEEEDSLSSEMTTKRAERKGGGDQYQGKR